MRCPAWIRSAIAAVALLAPGPAWPAGDPAAELGLVKPTPIRVARDFQIPTAGDGTLRLSDFKGKVVFLNFWATWCRPCEEEMPSIERLHRKFKDRGLVVLAISMDADGAPVVRPFVAKHKLTFPVGLDPRLAVSGPYGVWALPATLIIDRSGRIVLAANGPREWDGPVADALFESILKR